jgi:cysteinyl-tRNA synthetase
VPQLLSWGGSDVEALEAARAAFARVNGVLDIIPDRAPVDDADEIEAMLAERREARSSRDFARSDAIRNALEERGIEIKDGPSGTTWKRVR